jgi:Arc/MetJ family transcription regulator
MRYDRTMRTTVDLADDVVAAVEKLRRSRRLGLSEAVNELARAGLSRPRDREEFRQRTYAMGNGIDVANVADALETLEGPANR